MKGIIIHEYEKELQRNTKRGYKSVDGSKRLQS